MASSSKRRRAPRATIDLDGLFARGDALEEAGKTRQAYRLFLRGAEMGSVDCADRVGCMLGSGSGVRKDPERGLRWLHWARKRGSGPAAYNIAVTHAENGRWRRAYQWWKHSNAEQGGDEVELAMCLLEGLGARRNPARARALLRRHLRRKVPYMVSEAGQEWARALLGVMAATGLGCRKDLRAARRWLERANKDDDYPEARRVLALLGRHDPHPLDVARGAPWTTLVRRSTRAR
jgi:TPR repeat protein